MMRLEDVNASGASKVVEAHENPEMVRCFFRPELDVESLDDTSRKTSPAQARGTFLLQRLANILLPGVVPTAWSFGHDAKSGKYYMDVERVALDAKHLSDIAEAEGVKDPHRPPEHNKHEMDFYENRYAVETESAEVVHMLNDLGFKEVDDSPSNFTFAENKVRFLDMPLPWFDDPEGRELSFDAEKLERSINSLGDVDKQKEARGLLAELSALAATN